MVKQKLKPQHFFVGKGKISFSNNVSLGYFPSPNYYDGTIYLEARSEEASIHFGNNVIANNNLKIVCDKTKIEIADNVLIGLNVELLDSDFHSLDPLNRNRVLNMNVCQLKYARMFLLVIM